MKKYTTEFKLTVVQSFMAGEGGAKLLARRWSVSEGKIRTWVSHYRQHGIDGLRPKRSAYSAQFKREVLAHQDREQLSSRQVAAIYDIRNPHQVVVWRRQIDQDSVQSFGDARQGDLDMKPGRCRLTRSNGNGVDPAQVLQVLREENERLRAEVAYLKKLQALTRSQRSVAPTKHN